jgi:phage baseplate assembly protein W
MTTYVFSDIDLSFGLNIKNDIAKKYDVNSIKQSVKNIVMSRDRLFYPEFGPRISKMLFDLDTPFTKEMVRDEVKAALKKHEPRVEKVQVDFSGNLDQNEIQIDITFQIINIQGRYDVSVVLEKIR